MMMMMMMMMTVAIRRAVSERRTETLFAPLLNKNVNDRSLSVSLMLLPLAQCTLPQNTQRINDLNMIEARAVFPSFYDIPFGSHSNEGFCRLINKSETDYVKSNINRL